jgi:hypothetical protein
MPKWLRRFKPKDTMFYGEIGVELRGGDSPGQVTPPSKAPGVTTNVVCRSCNGHWMSDLEVWGSRVMAPMIEGSPQPLNIEDQASLAVWAIKTTMMWQTAPRNRRAIPLADYRWLHDQQTPPPLMKVRAGRLVATSGPFIEYSQQNLFLAETPDPPPPGLDPHAWRGILTIGQLLIEVIGSGDGNSIQERFPKMTGPVLLDIWPGTHQPVRWPPEYAMNRKALLRFLDATDEDLPKLRWGAEMSDGA